MTVSKKADSNQIMYAKVFSSMFEGTLRGRSDALLVFINMLAHSDKEGFDDRHFKAISDETGLTIERVLEAIKELEAPDPESRSTDLEGRRLERISEDRSWGWRIVNYEFYRQLRDAEERREQNRAAQARFRNKDKSDVSSSKQSSSKSANAEADVEEQAKDIYALFPLHVGKPKALRAIVKAIQKFGYDHVHAKTISYVTIRNGDLKTIPPVPYPATWYNQERFNDDATTWVPKKIEMTPAQKKIRIAQLTEAMNVIYKAPKNLIRMEGEKRIIKPEARAQIEILRKERESLR